MASVVILPGGTSGGFPPDPSTAKPGKRGQVAGWTPGQARRNLRFLWSINVADLDGQGWACTFTLGNTPDSADDWARARENLLDRCRDAFGLVRYHWVTEWTRKGRPHMHAALYLDHEGQTDVALVLAWQEIARRAGWDANWRGQHVVPIDGPTGWLQYVSKHAARGVDHYQREGAPPGWQRTGRLWGRGGNWPVEEEQVEDLTPAQFVIYRTLVWDWLIADMRARKVPADVVAKIEARWADPEHGNAHGVSAWIPGEVAYAFLEAAREAAPLEYEWDPERNYH